MREDINARDAKIDNIQLHYLTAGNAPSTVILLHDHITARNYFTLSNTIVWHVVALDVHHAQLPRCNQLNALARFDCGPFADREGRMTDCRDEFPASWFKRAKLSSDRARASLNYFGVSASQPLVEWRRKGWIHPDDPRGWFQWYCRYYCGRRSQDDLRQIGRWRAVRRHVAQLKKHCKPRDLNCRRRQRQALLHWAYDSRRI